MVDYKSKYLEMKFKYINAKQQIRGGMESHDHDHLHSNNKRHEGEHWHPPSHYVDEFQDSEEEWDEHVDNQLHTDDHDGHDPIKKPRKPSRQKRGSRQQRLTPKQTRRKRERERTRRK